VIFTVAAMNWLFVRSHQEASSTLKVDGLLVGT